MANSIDWGTMALGMLVGLGCRKQLKAAARVAATAAASLAGAAAEAAQQVAKETSKFSESPEEQAANAKLKEIDEKMQQQLQGKKGH